jgi:hypothetical protein
MAVPVSARKRSVGSRKATSSLAESVPGDCRSRERSGVAGMRRILTAIVDGWGGVVPGGLSPAAREGAYRPVAG